MRLGCINGLRFKHLKLATLAFFMLFLLWKWGKGTYYGSGVLRPDPLFFTDPGHLKHTETFYLKFLFITYYPHFLLNFRS
jgi:hypothetical protein